MSNYSYVELLEMNMKEYQVFIDFLREKHPLVFKEWQAAQQKRGADYLKDSVLRDNLELNRFVASQK